MSPYMWQNSQVFMMPAASLLCSWSLPLASVLNQMKTVRILVPYLCKFNVSRIITSSPCAPWWNHLEAFRTKYCLYLPSLLCSLNLIYLNFITLIIFFQNASYVLSSQATFLSLLALLLSFFLVLICFCLFPVGAQVTVRFDHTQWHTHTHTHTHTITHCHAWYDCARRGTGPSQRHLCENTQHSQETDIHAPRGIRTCNTGKRAAADARLKPRGDRNPSLLLPFM
jgi:hypothetical protein